MRIASGGRPHQRIIIQHVSKTISPRALTSELPGLLCARTLSQLEVHPLVKLAPILGRPAKVGV